MQPKASCYHAKWHQGGRRMKRSKMMSYIMHYQAALNESNPNQTAKFQRKAKFESAFLTIIMTSNKHLPLLPAVH